MDLDALLAQNVSDEKLAQWVTDDLQSAVKPVTIIFGTYIVLGILGNALTMYVFFFRYKLCNFRYFVLGLALTDFVSCLTTIPSEMFSYRHWYNYMYKFQWICKTKDLFNSATVLSEAAFLACIAVDRYLKVCRPLRRQISLRFAFRFSLMIFILSFILAIPTPIFWGIRTASMNVTSKINIRTIDVTICEQDENFLDTKFPLGHVVVFGTIVSIVDVLVVVLYVLIVRRLSIVQRRREKITVHPRDTIVELNGMDVRGTNSNKESMSNATSEQRDADTLTNSGNDQSAVRKETTDSSTQTYRGTELSRITKIRRKTLLGLYLTTIFIFTTVLYWSLLAAVANDNLETLNDQEKAVYFFFQRLYFVNHFINPILYGLMDPQFIKEMRRLKNKCFCFSNS